MSSYFCFSIRVCIKDTLDVISSDNVTLYANLYLANNVEYIVDFIPSKDEDGNLTFFVIRQSFYLNRFKSDRESKDEKVTFIYSYNVLKGYYTPN